MTLAFAKQLSKYIQQNGEKYRYEYLCEEISEQLKQEQLLQIYNQPPPTIAAVMLILSQSKLPPKPIVLGGRNVQFDSLNIQSRYNKLPLLQQQVRAAKQMNTSQDTNGKLKKSKAKQATVIEPTVVQTSQFAILYFLLNSTVAHEFGGRTFIKDIIMNLSKY